MNISEYMHIYTWHLSLVSYGACPRVYALGQALGAILARKMRQKCVPNSQPGLDLVCKLDVSCVEFIENN